MILIIQKASATVAASLGLPPGAVSIGTGDQPDNGFIAASDDRPTTIVIAVRAPGIDLDQAGAEKKILAAFSALPPMTAIAQTVPDEKLAADMGAKLRAATAETSFNAKLLEWPGFNPEIVKSSWAVNDFAVSYVHANAYGVEFNLSVPVDKNTDPKSLVAKIDANIKERMPAIKKLLADRVAKYTKANLQKAGKSEPEIADAVAKARAGMERLEITANVDANAGDSGITVALRSPEQAAANKTRTGDYKEPDNADTLRATNPLHTLSEIVTEQEKMTNPDASPQLNKALARSFLFGGDKAMEVFPLIAGRRDIKSAIAKELLSAAQKHPEKAPAFQEILASDLFKNHNNWRVDPKDAGAAPPSPRFAKDPKEADVLRVSIEVARQKVDPTIKALAAMAQQLQIPVAPAPGAIDPAAFQPPSSGWKNVLKKVLPEGWVGSTEQPAKPGGSLPPM